MKNLFKPNMIKSITIILITSLVVKIMWFVIGVVLLPKSSIDYIEEKGGQPLYYRVKLGPNEAPAPIVTKPKTVVTGGDIKDIQLLAIYNASDMIIVTVSFVGKTKVLSKGDKVKGFMLESADSDSAIFTKQGKTYKIFIFKPKDNDKAIRPIISTTTEPPKSTTAEGNIVDAGKLKIIDKSLVEHFATNLNEINKNIGIREIKGENGLMEFGISFIRKGSPFDKLGVRRGDVIKSINGQKIDSYNAAFGVYKNISNITNLSMVIERNKEEMELEYEVN